LEYRDLHLPVICAKQHVEKDEISQSIDIPGWGSLLFRQASSLASISPRIVLCTMHMIRCVSIPNSFQMKLMKVNCILKSIFNKGFEHNTEV
jgi:hypothetical protein